MAQAATRGCAGLGKARPVPVAPLRVGMERRCCHPRNPLSTRSSGGAGDTTAVPCEALVLQRARPLFLPDLAMSLGRFAECSREGAIPRERHRRSWRNFGFAGRGCRPPAETEDVGLAGPLFRADKTSRRWQVRGTGRKRRWRFTSCSFCPRPEAIGHLMLKSGVIFAKSCENHP
jgi:hypothetical protein